MLVKALDVRFSCYFSNHDKNDRLAPRFVTLIHSTDPLPSSPQQRATIISRLHLSQNVFPSGH
jgi:hypothetical protein